MINQIILLFFCTCCIPLLSQEHLESYTKNDGLTSSSVTTALVDSRGVVWIGTFNGIAAYSAPKWFAIKSITDSESGKTMEIGPIEKLFEDSKKNIWVASQTGLFLFDGQNWTSFNNDDDFIPVFFLEDRLGRIWIEYQYNQSIDASAQMSFDISNGMLHMYNDGRWINFDDVVGGSVVIESKYATEYFSSLLQDTKGNIWVGTLEGAFKFDGKDWDTFDEEVLKSDKVQFLLEDRNGDVWVALDNGVAHQRADGWDLFHKKDGLCKNNNYRLMEDNQSRIWAFARTDFKFAGLSVFEEGQWHKFTKKDYKLNSPIESLIMDEDKVIAFAKDGLAVFTGNTWQRYGKTDGLDEKEYLLIRKNRFGIWLAGESGFYHFKDDKWVQLHPSSEKWDVNVIFVENKDRIWLGTEKDGVYRYDNEKWTHFTEQSGLADNRVLDIFKDKKGTVWITGKTGVTHVLKE